VPLRGYQQRPLAKEGPGPADPFLVDVFEDLSHQALVAANIEPLVGISQSLKSNDVVLIRGIDFGAVAPTSAERSMHGSPHPEALIAGVARQLGCKLVGYTDQEKLNTHLLFHDIRALPAGREGANGGGMLGMHMDMGYRPDIRPNFVLLACLREGSDPDVKTPLVSSKALFDSILKTHPDDLSIFRDAKNWKIISPSTSGSFRVNTPLLTGSNEDPVFHCRSDRMFPLNERAVQALSHLHDAIAEHEVGIHLETGDLLVINNHKVLHRRTEFKASYDQHDRLLMRAYAKSADSVPAGRIYPLCKETQRDLEHAELVRLLEETKLREMEALRQAEEARAQVALVQLRRKSDALASVPMCERCRIKPTFNGKPGEYCTKACRAAAKRRRRR